MKRWGIYFDERLHEWYLHKSIHGLSILLSDERKVEYDQAMERYAEWQKFLSRKADGYLAKPPTAEKASNSKGVGLRPTKPTGNAPP